LIDRRKNLRYCFYDYSDWKIKLILNNEVLNGKIFDLSEDGMRAQVIDMKNYDVETEFNVDFINSSNKIYNGNLKLEWSMTNDSEYGFSTSDEKTSQILQSIIEKEKCNKIFSSTDGQISKNELPKIPGRGLYTEEARMDRVKFIRKSTNAKLDYFNESSFDANKLHKNIENYIGAVQIPVGIAGPLVVNRKDHKELVYAPFATTEGALVASATRGAVAISRAGGLNVKFLSQVMLRTPVFTFKNLNQAHDFNDWCQENFQNIIKETKKVSNFSNLYELDSIIFGKTVWLKLLYRTGDASGQNMTTSCTNHACKWILSEIEKMPELDLDFHIIEGNASSDKKVSQQSMLQGRGAKVHAEVFLPNEVIEDVLKLTPTALVKTYEVINKGGQLIGMTSVNTNVSNVIGAIFTATGQDIACVHESSLAHLEMQLESDGVYARMLLPSLVIGTVGGGTALSYQTEMLEIMDCAGPDKVQRFAEIICAFALGLDLSTTAAIGAGHFARAHDKLGRNRPVKWLKFDELDEHFMNEKFNLEIENFTLNSSYHLKEFKLGSSIITELTSRNITKTVGLFPFRLIYADNNDESNIYTKEVMLKIKPLGSEVVLMLNTMASMCNTDLSTSFNQFKDSLGFSHTHTKELNLYNIFNKLDQKKYMPIQYGTYENKEREIYICAMELLQDVELMNTAGDVSLWDDEKIKCVIDGISDIHSLYYNKTESLVELDWMGHTPTANSRIEKMSLWNALAENARLEHNDFVNKEHLELFRDHIDLLPKWWKEIDSMPKTLIHNDFNPRNLALKKNNDKFQLCLYDFELMSINIPQRDLAEFLIFVLNRNTTLEELEEYIELHRERLEFYTQTSIDKKLWRRGFKLAVYDFCVERLLMYLMAHTFRHYKFMERIFNTSIHMIELMKEMDV
jgi:hydroxymethylglutaryl-CoA reductase (NADPH)